VRLALLAPTLVEGGQQFRMSMILQLQATLITLQFSGQLMMRATSWPMPLEGAPCSVKL